MQEFPGASRFKSRPFTFTTTVPTIKLKRLSDGAILSEYGGGIKTIAMFSDEIRYTTKRKGDRHSSNFCMHMSERDHTPDPGVISILWYTAANPTAVQEYSHGCVAARTGLDVAKSTALAAFGVTTGFSVLAANGQAYMNQYFDSMRPDLTEVSVPNFLLDIGQLKSMLSFMRSKRGFVSTLNGRQLREKLMKLKRLLNPKELGKELANKNLEVQYGWIPTHSDIQNMLESILGTQRKIRSWNESVGQVYSRSRNIPLSSLTKTGTVLNYGGWANIDWSSTIDQKAVARIKYRTLPIPALSEFEKGLRGSLDGLGFELNPAIIWDAIPFSFVVDWFLNVGGAIERFKVDTLELPIKLIDSYIQFKEQWRVDCRLKQNATSDSQAAFMPGATYTRKIFHRMPGAPDMSVMNSLGWRSPSWNQYGLALSLGLSRHKFK